MSKKKKSLEDLKEIDKSELNRGKVIGNSDEISQYILPSYKFSSNWSSPESFAKYIKSLDQNKAWHNSGWEKGDKQWKGSDNMEETLDLVEEGWQEGAEQVEKLRERIEAAHPIALRMRKHGIAGAYPNVPRAIAGNIQHMKIPDMTRSRKKPVITLVSNMASNWTVGAHQISNRAAAVAALVDKIESSGYSVEVISTATTKGGSWDGETGYTACTSIVVKRSDQPVDIKRLAFGLGHVSLFRRMVFADWGVEPSANSGLGRGLGCHESMHVPKDDEFDVKGIYTLESCENLGKYFDTEDRSMVDGVNNLMQQLKDQGCPAFKNAEIPPMTDDAKWEKQPVKKKKAA